MDEKSNVKVVFGLMPTRRKQRVRRKNRIEELESEIARFRERHGKDVARIRELESQVERLKRIVEQQSSELERATRSV